MDQVLLTIFVDSFSAITQLLRSFRSQAPNISILNKTYRVIIIYSFYSVMFWILIVVFKSAFLKHVLGMSKLELSMACSLAVWLGTLSVTVPCFWNGRTERVRRASLPADSQKILQDRIILENFLFVSWMDNFCCVLFLFVLLDCGAHHFILSQTSGLLKSVLFSGWQKFSRVPRGSFSHCLSFLTGDDRD